MSNIEGENKLQVDLGIVRGPKGQAADRLAELRELRRKASTPGQKQELHTMKTFSDALNKLFDSVEFLLEQFSK